MNTFEKLDQAIRSSEASLVNLLSALAPWAAPLAPAYMTFSHITRKMGFPIEISWAVALVVEVLGLSSISTILAFWSYNRRYKDKTRKAPVWIAIFSFVIYLAVILMVNVALDAADLMATPDTQAWVNVGARALLTLLSIPAAIILAVRTQHKEMLDAYERDRERSREERRHTPAPVYRGVASSGANGSLRRKGQFFLDVQSGKLTQVLEEKGLPLTAESIAQLYGVSERNAFRWLADMKRNGG